MKSSFFIPIILLWVSQVGALDNIDFNLYQYNSQRTALVKHDPQNIIIDTSGNVVDAVFPIISVNVASSPFNVGADFGSKDSWLNATTASGKKISEETVSIAGEEAKTQFKLVTNSMLLPGSLGLGAGSSLWTTLNSAAITTSSTAGNIEFEVKPLTSLSSTNKIVFNSIKSGFGTVLEASEFTIDPSHELTFMSAEAITNIYKEAGLSASYRAESGLIYLDCAQQSTMVEKYLTISANDEVQIPLAELLAKISDTQCVSKLAFSSSKTNSLGWSILRYFTIEASQAGLGLVSANKASFSKNVLSSTSHNVVSGGYNSTFASVTASGLKTLKSSMPLSVQEQFLAQNEAKTATKPANSSAVTTEKLSATTSHISFTDDRFSVSHHDSAAAASVSSHASVSDYGSAARADFSVTYTGFSVSSNITAASSTSTNTDEAKSTEPADLNDADDSDDSGDSEDASSVSSDTISPSETKAPASSTTSSPASSTSDESQSPSQFVMTDDSGSPITLSTNQTLAALASTLTQPTSLVNNSDDATLVSSTSLASIFTLQKSEYSSIMSIVDSSSGSIASSSLLMVFFYAILSFL